jgi:phosphoserine aminotransferase
MGPAGVTLVIIRKDLVENCADNLTSMLSYKTYAEKESLYNTPPCFAIYIVKLVMEWIEARGGIAAVEKMNEEKANILYDMIDNNDMYHGTAAVNDRSIMNVTFRLTSEELEAKFIAEATDAGLVGVKGHRSVGGCRASIYNAMPKEGVEKLVEFMGKFAAHNS